MSAIDNLMQSFVENLCKEPSTVSQALYATLILVATVQFLENPQLKYPNAGPALISSSKR